MARKDEEKTGGHLARAFKKLGRKVDEKLSRKPAMAPMNPKDTVLTLAKALRFAYSETLGKWHVLDLAKALLLVMFKQSNVSIASLYGGSGCVQLKGPRIITELHVLSRLLTLCTFFSSKKFRVFLRCAGISRRDVLVKKTRSGILRPSFTLVRDAQSECFLLLIRGTRNIYDTLTDATGSAEPFGHFVLSDDGTSKLVSGYAHHGMVAAARWIEYNCTPPLLNALDKYPTYNIKVVGHSLGGGTAALLTYILRAKREFSSTICVTFGPAACMTWELAEAGKHFVTTVINGSDLVPTLSASSVYDLLSDQEDNVELRNVLSAVYHSAHALASHLPLAGAILRSVTGGMQVDMEHKQSVGRTLLFSPESQRGNFGTLPNSKADNMAKASQSSKRTHKSHLTEELITQSMLNKDEHDSSSEGSGDDDTDEGEQLISDDQYTTTSIVHGITESELRCILEEFERHDINSDIHAQVKEEERATTKEITVVDTAESSNAITTLKNLDNRCFYPPGRIMHIVPIPSSDPSNSNIYLYETPRELYSKLRLSRRMLFDHFTVRYKHMVERVIRQLEKEQHLHGK